MPRLPPSSCSSSPAFCSWSGYLLIDALGTEEQASRWLKQMGMVFEGMFNLNVRLISRIMEGNSNSYSPWNFPVIRWKLFQCLIFLELAFFQRAREMTHFPWEFCYKSRCRYLRYVCNTLFYIIKLFRARNFTRSLRYRNRLKLISLYRSPDSCSYRYKTDTIVQKIDSDTVSP